VIRHTHSAERRDFYQKIVEDLTKEIEEKTDEFAKSDPDKIQTRLKLAETIETKARAQQTRLKKIEILDTYPKRPSRGTGILLTQEKLGGWFVITNNHVIMNDEEATTAVLKFDFDEENASVHTFKVEKVLHCSDPTQLDYSLLVVGDCRECSCDFKSSYDHKGGNHEGYLNKRAINFDSATGYIKLYQQEYILEPLGLQSIPIVLFSHPGGGPKHISIGRASSLKDLEDRVEHSLTTAPGSSGANLLFPMKIPGMTDWTASFIHYAKNKDSAAPGRAKKWTSVVKDIYKNVQKAFTSRDEGYRPALYQRFERLQQADEEEEARDLP
jgi:hypothetical protein